LHPLDWDPYAVGKSGTLLKSASQRSADRIKAGLPILQSKDQYINTLRQNKFVVVTAETGSGKTTQLPQYSAEAFDGLIVCTQPRAIAAISIAQRIADEYDGSSAGENVGYRVGRGKSVQGRRIMLMTDAALVQMAQQDQHLESVSVLIIDEAHERSLNTDIVLGIAKLIRQARPTDFCVVIASATIDPKPFVDFFAARLPSCVISVSGRTFPVTDEYKDTDSDSLLRDGTLVSEVISAMKTHSEGNCLVFLSGSAEVDKAIKQLKQQAATRQEPWTVLPLYGSLPPEEQSRVMSFDDEGGSLRMVVFCTNVAETSLTVPNTRLVIDTGLAKEARYDTQRRITILEQVYISQSSADQRKGRAGRTAAGHCVRLFSRDKLQRKNIQPEILRSSLDSVVLTLCRLGYDPVTFPLIDRPPPDAIRTSVEVLMELDCVVVGPTQRPSITKRGRLFSELPFDPRLSSFVAKAHVEYQSATLAAEVAAILSAPGSVFFTSGETLEDRQASKAKVAEAASRFSSDLLFLSSVYQSWASAGKLSDKGRCPACQRQYKPSFDRCRPCRIKHTVEQSLNNKVLEIVHQNKLQVLEVICQLSQQQQSSTSCTPEEVIGRCLSYAFPEQVAELLVGNNPDAGAFLASSKLKTMLSGGSALTRDMVSDTKLAKSTFIIAMAITKIPSGSVIIDKMHRIDLKWLPTKWQSQVHSASLGMTLSYSRAHISARYANLLTRHFQGASKEIHGFQFVVCTYDSKSNSIVVFSPKAIRTRVGAACASLIDSQIQQDMEYEEKVAIGEGSATVTLVAGMSVERVDSVGMSCYLRLASPPVSDPDTFKKWLIETTKLPTNSIKWSNFNAGGDGGGSFGEAMFRDQTSAQTARKAVVAMNLSIADTSDWGRAVRWNTEFYLPDLEARQRAHQFGVNPIKIDVRVNHPAKYQIRFGNLTADLRPELQRALGRTKLTELGTKFGVIIAACAEFATEDERNNMLSNLIANPALQSTININITTKRGKERAIATRLRITPSVRAGKAQHICKFSSSEEATKLYEAARMKGHDVSGEATARILHPGLFQLETLAFQTAKKLGVQWRKKSGVTTPESPIPTDIVTFEGGPPIVCGRAAQALAAVTAPLKLHFKSREQQLLITQLSEASLLDQWASELGVSVSTSADNRTRLVFRMIVYGPQTNQGQLMVKIGDASDTFQCRYTSLSLDATTACLFRPGRAGDAKLRALDAATDDASITFNNRDSSIDVLVSTSNSSPVIRLKELVDKIQSVTRDLGKAASRRMCVYCSQPTGTTFTLCGHHYCKSCLGSISSASCASGASVKCSRCQTTVCIRDIRASCDSRLFSSITLSAVRAYLLTHPHHPEAMCRATESCGGFIKRQAGYSSCPVCCVSQCPMCGVQDTKHEGRTCQEYRRYLRRNHSLDKLFQDARAFVTAKWPTTITITRVEENPGVNANCPAMQRYCEALKTLGGSPALSSGFFAWHGTPIEAIVPICHYGFDPSKRVGQAYGTGEYFGQEAGISVGYCRNGNKMIVAHILRHPCVKTQDTLCYVVNNPRDWQLSYCLPVLVITFQSDSEPTQFTVQQPTRLQLFPTTEDGDSDDDTSDPTTPSKQVSVTGTNAVALSRYSYTAPFRWSWKKDDGTYEPYPDSINSLIETNYTMYKTESGLPIVEIGPVKRYIDDRPQIYCIDFPQLIQTNTSTNYQRALLRQQVEVPTNQNIKWQFLNERGIWKSYESLVQKTIESGYRDYIENGPGVIQTTFPGRSEAYSINYIQGQQVNTISSQMRQIRRMVGTAASEASLVTFALPARGSLHLFAAPSTLDPLRMRLTNIVRRAAGTTKQWTHPLFTVDAANRTALLTLYGPVACSIAGVLAGEIQSAIYQQMGSLSAKVNVQGNDALRALNNPRLMLLTSSARITPSQSRADALMFIAHTLIWKAGCSIYGGFVRDWVINGESANDLDCELSQSGQSETNRVTKILRTEISSTSITYQTTRQKGPATCLTFSGPWAGHDIEVDLVDPNLPRNSPGIDCDVGNLQISANGLAKKLPQAGEPDLPLFKIIKHCRAKKFVFFYNISQDPSMCMKRIIKYLSRGWKCLSPIPQTFLQRVPSEYAPLLQPQQKFSRTYWAR
jgi:HrpA-like RNA helicase